MGFFPWGTVFTCDLPKRTERCGIRPGEGGGMKSKNKLNERDGESKRIGETKRECLRERGGFFDILLESQ